MITANQKLMKIRLVIIAIAVLVLALAFLVVRARGQQASPPAAAAASPATAQQPQVVAIPAANPEDVKSIDSIVAAVYDVISGPAGDRNWNRFRSLFAPEARLIPVRPPAAGTASAPDGKASLAVLTVDDYVNRGSAGFKQNGFFESEVSRKQEQFG